MKIRLGDARSGTLECARAKAARSHGDEREMRTREIYFFKMNFVAFVRLDVRRPRWRSSAIGNTDRDDGGREISRVAFGARARGLDVQHAIRMAAATAKAMA